MKAGLSGVGVRVRVRSLTWEMTVLERCAVEVIEVTVRVKEVRLNQ